MSEERLGKDEVLIGRQGEKTEAAEEREAGQLRPQAPAEDRDGGRSDKPVVSETWAEETIADLDEFIESQGIYIRQ